MSFKIGDLVVLVNDGLVTKPKNLAAIGLHGTITRKCENGLHHWEVLASDNSKWHVTESCLRRIDPPSTYDGNQAGDWDLCPWQPQRTEA